MTTSAFGRRVWPWLAAIATGILPALSIPPCDQGWLSWIALTPLLAAVWFSGEGSRRRGGRDFFLGYVSGLIFFWVSFYWLTTVTGIGWFILEFYLGLYFGFWSWVAGLLRPGEKVVRGNDKWSEMLARAETPARAERSPWLSSGHNLAVAFLLSAAWVAQEWTRGWMFSGFGWNGLGVALHANWPIIQIAEVTGVAGVTFLVVFANVILVTTARRLWIEARTRMMRPHYDVTFTMVGLMAIFIFGINTAGLRGPSKPFQVALIQSAVARDDKFDLRNKEEIFAKFERLSTIALAVATHCDLLVWPESSMPAPVLQDRETLAFVTNFARERKVPLLLGAIDDDGKNAYNAAMLVVAGEKPQTYRKIHLVPFGEYIPFRYSFPLFAKIIGDQVPGDFDRGHDYTLFELPNGGPRLAPLICFEDTIGDLTRQFVRRGADLLVNVTNDGWFLQSAESRQHLANAVFRCVENRRPLVCAANTGVTAMVNQAGRVTEILRDGGNIFDEGTLVGAVTLPVNPPMTFYTRHGELFAKICALIAVAFIGIRLIGRWRRPSGVA